MSSNANAQEKVQRFVDQLNTDGFITDEQVDALFSEVTRLLHQGMSPGKAIVAASGIPNSMVQLAIMRSAGEPVSYDLAGEGAEDPAIELLPRERAESMTLAPIRLDGSTLVLAAPVDKYKEHQSLRSDLSIILQGRVVQFMWASREQVEHKIGAIYRNDRQIQTAGETPDNERGDAAVQIVQAHLEQAVKDRASDIHFEPNGHEMTVRYRIDGVLVPRVSVPLHLSHAVISRIKILSGIEISERRKGQDGRYSFPGPGGRTIDMRVVTAPYAYGEGAVLRILDNTQASLSIESLGMEQSVLDTWMSACLKPQGMILVTGPTGSGKSTTLYSTLGQIATPKVNVLTIEDPVEYKIPGINQMQVNVKAGWTFANALRSSLRQDPDVILVGEIRDSETAKIAIESAQTGHLVLSTLHTNDAPSAATRLTELGVDAFMVAEAVTCILAQRLVRSLCNHCKQPAPDHPEVLESVGFHVPPGTPVTLFEPVGCTRCVEGYKGRIAVHEVLDATSPEVTEAITRKLPTAQVADIARQNGMRRLLEDGWMRVAGGHTTVAEVLRSVSS